MGNEKTIPGYWRDLATQLTNEELIAYSQNGVGGAIREILKDSFTEITKQLSSDCVEVGALFAPLAFELPYQVSRVLFLDPAYKIRRPQFNTKIPYELSTLQLPDGIQQITQWLQGETLLILGSVVNYLARETVSRLIRDSNITEVIVGNNFQAGFGEKHESRIRTPRDLQGLFLENGFKEQPNVFHTDVTVVGIFSR